MIREAIAKLTRKEDLTYEEARGVMEEMMDGTATQAQMGGLLMALSMQGETIDEITAFAEVMREKGVKIKPEREVIDIVGTGGDQVGTFNISTTSAFVVAAGGVPVAKHGNRSVSSRSGAADVLEKLGVEVALTAEQNEKVLNETDICFCLHRFTTLREICGTGQKGAGSENGIQHSRTSFQSGSGNHAASRCI